MFYRSTSEAAPELISPELNSVIIESFRSGEEKAFEAIHRAFYRPILSWLRKRVSDEPVAEDLAKEIFLKVHCARLSFDTRYRFTSWIWTIARNTWRDWVKSADNRASSHLLAEGLHEEVECPGPGPEEIFLKRTLRRKLFRYATKLSSKQRRVLWLSWVLELSHAEISQTLGITLDAVKSLSYRARQLLATDWSRASVLSVS